jgi:hypothetical protein
VSPRAGLDAVESRKISFPCRESNPSRAACSPSLYRLLYLNYKKCIASNTVKSAGWSSSNGCRLAIGICFVRISAGTSAVPTEAFRGSLQSSHANTKPARQLGHNRLLSILPNLLFTSHFTILHRIINVDIEGSWGWDSAIGITTGYRLDSQRVRVRVPVGIRIFTSPCRPDRLLGPHSVLSNGQRGALSLMVNLITPSTSAEVKKTSYVFMA